MARTFGDSLELFISISNSYSFPGMHCVTSKEGVEADGEIVINRSINTAFALCVFPLLMNDRCLPLLDETTPIMSSAHGSNVISSSYDVVIRVQ